MAFETKYICGDCTHIFYKVTEKDPRKVGGRIPSCPLCKESKKTQATSHMKVRGDVREKTQEEKDVSFQEIISSQKAPSVGGSLKNKAVDMTAEMVMKDYGMTDINMGGNLREGDNCVPKLQGKDGSGVSLEDRVSQVFKPQKPIMGAPQANNMNKTLLKQINAGAFKAFGGSSDVVARQQASGIKPDVNIMYDYKGKPN